MKNIIIMGVCRTGKTTLSKMLKESYPQYDVIHADAIKWGIIRAQGQEAEFRKNIAKQMAWEKSTFFQNVLIEIFVYNIQNNNNPFVLETGQLYLENLIKHPKYDIIKESTDIIVLGVGNKTSQQRAWECKAHDVETDWTYGVSDKMLSDYSVDWEKQDLKRIKECEQYGVLYYDTSGDRMKVLNQIIKKYKRVRSVKLKKNYVYTDNFGKRHKMRISSDDVSCVPYAFVDTGVRALRVNNLCKLMFWEKYNDVNLCSKSIICKYDESLLHKSFSKNDICKLTISEERLEEIVNGFGESL